MINVFSDDLKVGKYHEEEICTLIQKKYPQAYIIDGYCKEWDIYIPELELGVEVKADNKSLYTGNIVIEVEFNDKPSALSTTKSDWWVIYDGIRYNWFKISNIKNCIAENKLKLHKFIGRGDTKFKKAYLISKALLYKYRTL